MDDTAEAAAFHEAGHAVVGYALGEQIELVTIIPREGVNGRTEFRPLPIEAPTDVKAERLVIDATVLMGGVVGEREHRGEMNAAGARRDNREAIDALARNMQYFGVVPDPDSLTDRLTECLRRAEDVIGEHRAALCALARAVLAKKILTGAEATAVLRGAFADERAGNMGAT